MIEANIDCQLSVFLAGKRDDVDESHQRDLNHLAGVFKLLARRTPFNIHAPLTRSFIVLSLDV